MTNLETKVLLGMMLTIAEEETLSEAKRLEIIIKSIKKNLNED